MATERKTEFVFCISKRDKKKKIPSRLVEVSNSFDIIFGLFSALFPSDFIWKIVSNTLFSWPMRTEGHFKDVQQCMIWKRNTGMEAIWLAVCLMAQMRDICLKIISQSTVLGLEFFHLSFLNNLFTAIKHCLIWISEETQQEKIHAKNKKKRGLELTPWVVRKRCDWNRKW